MMRGEHDSGRQSPAQKLSIMRERWIWNRRAATWDSAGSAGLVPVVGAVLDACPRAADTVALDLGAGSGQVTIPLAARCRCVVAVDVSAALMARCRAKAAEQGVHNIRFVTEPIETLRIAPHSVDLIVSNYALHHLRDRDKARLMGRTYDWLRPGGRLVIGDMMFGRGAAADDRAIIASKVARLVHRGPGGWWRLLKNAVRFTFRIWEKPLPPHRWEALAWRSGYREIVVRRVVSEAWVLSAVKPGAAAGS